MRQKIITNKGMEIIAGIPGEQIVGTRVLEDFLMAKKPTYEELEQRVKDLEKEIKKRGGVRTRKDTTLHRRVEEFINKYPSAIKKIPPKEIQYLVEDLQIHKTELEIQNEKLRRTQLELQETRDKYSDLYDNAPVGYFSIDNEGKILGANLSGATMLSMEQGSLKGRPFSDFVARDDQDIFYLHRQKLVETKGKQTCELRLVKKNGSQFFAYLECIVMLDEEGKFSQIRAAINDINERKEAEQALLASEEKYRGLFDESIAAVYLFDEKKNFLDSNQAGLDLIGYSIEELLSMSISDVDADPIVVLPAHEQLLSGDRIINYEHKIKRKDGKVITVLNNSRPLTNDDEQVVGMQSTLMDITSREQAEKALRQAHDELERRVEERTAELSKVNKQLKREIEERKRAEEVLRESDRELIIRNRIVETFLTARSDEMYGEVLKVILDAMESPYGTFAYINEDGDRIVPSMTRDIWDECNMPDKGIFFPRDTWGDTLWARCIIEKKSFSSNGPFKIPDGHISIVRALATPIIYQGESIGNLMVGDKSTDYFGKDKELLETIADHIAPILHARLLNERHEKKRKQVEEALRKQTHNLDERVKELNCLYGISKLIEAPDISFEEVLQGVVNLIPPSWQYPEITCARMIIEDQVFVTDNFKETIWKQTANITLYEKQIGLLEVFYLEEKPEIDEGPFSKEERGLIDAIAERLARIIERRRTEEALKDAQEELMLNDKLAAIGKLSGNIAHEIRNPLGVIGSSVYYLKRNLKGKNKKLGEHLERIESQVTKAAAIIESMLNLTRIRASEPHRVDLKAIISEVISAPKIPNTINKIQHFPPEDVFVKANPEQLTMSFNNIVTNAIDAMDRVGTLTVTVQRASGDRAELSFADTGPGIDPKNLDKVFHPLFSTKNKGIGFGLSIVKTVIEDHDGTIELVSELEKGTTIIIRLPLDTDTNKEK